MSPAAKAIPDVQDLEAKFLAEIEQELETLRPAHEQYEKLVEMRGRMTGPVRVNGRTVRSGGTRQRSGVNRQDQFIALVKANPGMTISEAATQIGDVQPNYLYRVRDRAKTAGLIREENGKHYAVEAS